MKTYLEIDDVPVLATQVSWITTAPCGCVSGIQLAQITEPRYEHNVLTESAAWAQLYEGRAEKMRRDKAAGFTIRPVLTSVGVDLLQMKCEHEPRWGVEPPPVPDGMEWAAPGWRSTSRDRSHLVSAGRPKDVTRDRVASLCGKRAEWSWSSERHDVTDLAECLACWRLAKEATS